ncbi:hypothetical protein TNIN_430051 [Trichonephila inaurata madagascariensis]|uniref:Uncharacterized protein n=1 Tax=Trichonephila inaurata madagascariensis TaxID=2747483 RepID=A0A8X6YKN5_9ARAC|nr:hypothetical protein TNIN_430051 [Trichonephila inaurata madagascariensis]
MAESNEDVFYEALENQCKIIESALLLKCNMNQQMREEARIALDRDKLMTTIEANPKFLKPTVPKRKNPTMLIRNVPNDVGDSELLDVIREQNPEILVSNECWNKSTVRFVLKKFQHVRAVVMEFHPKIRKKC